VATSLFVVFLALLTALTGVAVGFASDSACRSLSEETGMPTKYRFQSGCFIKVKGQWVPDSAWKVVE
jgi:hypothetical protein